MSTYLIIAKNLHLADIQLSERGCRKIRDAVPEWTTPNNVHSVRFLSSAQHLRGVQPKSTIFTLPHCQERPDWPEIAQTVRERELILKELV